MNESSSFFFSLKVSFKEKPKFIPYMSLSYGMDWLDMLNVSVTDPISANPAAVYGKNSYSMILTPAAVSTSRCGVAGRHSSRFVSTTASPTSICRR